MHHVFLSNLSIRPTVWLRGVVSDQPASATTPGQLDGVVGLLWPSALWALGVGVAAVALAVGARFLGRAAGSSEVAPATADVADATSAPFTTLDDDEQFVVDLLRSNDGRVRQSVIVETSSWSKSKVSRLLSRMERDGYVEKVGVGRENVVVLVGAERAD
jgi:uncharacterized membrane protein